MDFLFIKTDNKSIDYIQEKVDSIFKENIFIKLKKGFFLFISKNHIEDCLVNTDNITAYILGYIRDYRLGSECDTNIHNIKCVEKISKSWPLDSNYTGSFSVAVYEKNKNALILANDPIGIYPIYYSLNKDEVVVSSSLILASSILANDLDYAGIAERLMPGDYCNFGKRTIVKDIYRLLPGEKIEIDINNYSTILDNKYDNTLYRDVSNSNIDILASKAWSLIKKEVEYAFLKKDKIGLALSGGLDSRIVLGAIDKHRCIICTTYGDEDDYETKIARKCAQVKNCDFHSYSVYDYLFPPKKILEKYTIGTESMGMNNWLSILENCNDLYHKDIYLLGDTCDLLTAKNILTYRSRNSKVKNFFKYLILGREIPFTPITNENYNKWKNNKINSILNRIRELYPFDDIVKYEDIEKEIIIDVEELLNRIESHNIPYLELLDELFGIYTHGRIAMSKQLLLTKQNYFPIAPVMSMQIARFALNIDPRQKMNFILFNKIFKCCDDLNDLSDIPTAQIPYIPYKANNILKLFIWGLRSTIDQVLIKRKMKSKDRHKRTRVMKSIDWFKAYRQENGEQNIESWFEKDNIRMKQYCLDTYKKRSSMESWPLVPFDIVSLASLNLEISSIEELKLNHKKDKVYNHT